MKKILLLALCALMASAYTIGCPAPAPTEKTVNDGGTADTTPTDTTPTDTTPTDTTPKDDATPKDEVADKAGTALYDRLGKEAGIRTVIKDFIGRVVGDVKINGYFLNQGVDAKKLEDCLVKQVGQATGGPEKYDCRDMKTTHTGMGISKTDFGDLVTHLVDALKKAGVVQADIDIISGVLGPMETDIVEDAENKKTIYQRIGRRPAIQKVITEFVTAVVTDQALAPFFAEAVKDTKRATRLGACLVRQVCAATGGPCVYGKEAGEAGIEKACATDMKALHKDMKIANADFTKLVGHLVTALKANNVAEADITAIAGVLGPMCSDIVEVDPTSCGAAPDALYKRLGSEAGIRTVIKDFIGRVVGDVKINGYFLNQGVDAKKLEDCLVKQVGQATGGPEKYDCRDMKTTHTGMGISKTDFTDLVTHLVDALKKAGVVQADIDIIAGVLGPMEADIVEDASNDKSVYQRIGRRPAIVTVVTDFVARVVGDTTLKPFFTATLADPAKTKRLGACLVRQVCGATGGPCQYGKEAGEDGIDNATPCVTDMKALHNGMNITKADFDKLVGHLVDALKAANVPQAEIDAIAAALLPTCKDIVDNGNGTGCP